MYVVLTPEREQTLQSRVMRGVETLDAVSPDWWKNIDLEQLSLTSCLQCVLGQLYGDFMRGVICLTESLEDAQLLPAEHVNQRSGTLYAAHYGFDHDEDLQCDWAEEDEEDAYLADSEDGPRFGNQLDLLGSWWSDIIHNRQQQEK